MKSLSIILKVIFYISFVFLCLSFGFHIAGKDYNLLSKVGVIVLLSAPSVIAMYSCIWFAMNKNFKMSITSFLLLAILILNMILN